MITLKEMLIENRDSTAKKGCLMAMLPKKDSDLIVEFGKRLIRDDGLYYEGDEYGREKSPLHCTIRYGFIRDLNELEVRQLIKGQKQFIIELIGLNKFDPDPKYSVSVFKVNSPVLKRLNELSGIYPNETNYPEYKQHITIGYVKPNVFIPTKEGIKLKVPVRTLCYSPISGDKSYYNLDENEQYYDVNAETARLEEEWNKLDSVGGQKGRQTEIEKDLIRLKMENISL